MSDTVSVLIVDDSALMRNLISRMVEATPGMSVADRAMNGIFALQKIPRCDPDVVVLDLEMPEMNGIEFLKERKRLGLELPVVILSSIARRGAEITMEALALGASDFIMKPTGSASEDVRFVKDQLMEKLFAYGAKYRAKRGKPTSTAPLEELEAVRDADVPPRMPAAKPLGERAASFERPAAKAEARPVPARKPGPTELIALGISTGGPNALREVFAKIDPDLSQPILVVQHMPPGFTAEFAKSLDRVCPLEVKEAADGDLVKSGRVLIAPGDRHIEVEKKALATIVRVVDTPPVNGHRPSADVLFASVAREFGNRAMGVIMTGMGRDGAKEIGSIYEEGGITLGQDEHSSVVYGMPKVAYEMGHVMEQVALADMAARICALAKEKR